MKIYLPSIDVDAWRHKHVAIAVAMISTQWTIVGILIHWCRTTIHSSIIDVASGVGVTRLILLRWQWQWTAATAHLIHIDVWHIRRRPEFIWILFRYNRARCTAAIVNNSNRLDLPGQNKIECSYVVPVIFQAVASIVGRKRMETTVRFVNAQRWTTTFRTTSRWTHWPRIHIIHWRTMTKPIVVCVHRMWTTRYSQRYCSWRWHRLIFRIHRNRTTIACSSITCCRQTITSFTCQIRT